MKIFNERASLELRSSLWAITAILALATAGFAIQNTKSPANPKQIEPAAAKQSADSAWPAAPKPGVCLPIEIIAIHDGDTLTARVEMKVSVRLLDCWAPEVTGSEKEHGIVTRDRLRALAHGCKGVLMVPTTENFGTSVTFGRVLGHVWLTGDPKSLSQRLVEEGLATKDKPK